MIPEHLKEFAWKREYFFDMKNTANVNGRWTTIISWDINDAGIKAVVAATPEITGIKTNGSMVAGEGKNTTVLMMVTIVYKGMEWSDAASATNEEFERRKKYRNETEDEDKEEKVDRRKFHIGQMAFTRALNRAVMSALGINQDDIVGIVKKLGMKSTKLGRTRTVEAEPPTPKEVVKEVEEMGDVSGLATKLGIKL
jgi:hypothetical protein